MDGGAQPGSLNAESGTGSQTLEGFSSSPVSASEGLGAG